MPFLNQESRPFTDAEKTTIKGTVNTLITALKPNLANLSAEERQRFGSVNEQNKLIINKVKDYKDSQPALSTPDVDWEEFEADYQTRSLLQANIEQLVELVRGMENAKILHDWDNYQAALVDYNYTQYKNGSGASGYATKEQELKQFFNRTSTKYPNDDV